MSNSAGNPTEPLIRRLDDAVSNLEGKPLCEAVKSILTEELTRRDDVIADRLLAGSSNGYARRLLHRDGRGRYSVLVMVWSPGQETPLHDHGGLWCVECVYRGKIRVTSYDRIEVNDSDTSDGHTSDGHTSDGHTSDGHTSDGECARFVPAEEIHAGVGEAGSLIPPVDYHVIDNPNDEIAATVHVYGGDMDRCNVYEPVIDDLYRKKRCDLSFSC